MNDYVESVVAHRFQWGAQSDIKALPRGRAQTLYKEFLDEKGFRVQQVQQLIADKGLRFDSTDPDFTEVEVWLYHNSQGDVESRHPDDRATPIDLVEPWLSINYDLTLLVSEIAIEQHPNLYWELLNKGGRLMYGYNTPVIKGFSQVSPLHYRPVMMDAFDVATLGAADRLWGDCPSNFQQLNTMLLTLMSRA